MATNIRPRTESLRAPCSPSDPSPSPWVCLMYQKTLHGYLQIRCGLPQEESVPVSIRQCRVTGSMSPAAARFAQRLAIRVRFGPEPFGDVLGAVARRPPT